MLDGKIQSLVTDKGFGFIKPAAGGADVFFHYSTADAPFESLAQGQQVKYELDSTADKPKARSVQTGQTSANKRPTRPNDRRSPNVRSRGTGRPAVRKVFEHGFVTKLHRKEYRGFISSVKHGPEFLFSAESVTGEKRYSRLEIGDYVEFLVAEPDPAAPKQPVAKAVQVVEREVERASEKQLARHPNSRKKKPTWR